MIVKETTDKEEIKAVLCHPEIYDCIAGDGCPPREEFEPPIDSEHKYIGGFVKGEIIALMVYHAFNNGSECHVQVIPTHREQFAFDFGKKSLGFRDASKPLYATIPTKYPNVLSFASLFGFEAVKTIKDDYTKNGKKYDNILLEYRG
jgi:hypothetical protein